MSISKPGGPALILIDIQKGFANIEYWGGQRNNPDAEFRASELLSVWRENDFLSFMCNIALPFQLLRFMKPMPEINLMIW